TPVHQPDAVALQLAVAQPFRLALRSARDRGLRLLDEWTNHVRLAARVEVLAQTPVRLARALLRDPCGRDRLAVRRRLRDLAHLEVAVDGQRKRSRNGRRSHVQDVRRSTSRDRAALLHSEPVLLVDYGNRDLAQVDPFLDQRMGADEYLRCAWIVLHGTGEQGDLDAELAARLLERQE